MEQQRSGIPSFEARAELSMELLHATEAAALACAGLLGKGDPDRVSDAAGHAVRGALDLDDSIVDNLRRIAFARDVRVQDLTIAILERPRHQELITEVAASGARIRTLEEGDFASAVMAALPETGIDAAIGI